MTFEQSPNLDPATPDIVIAAEAIIQACADREYRRHHAKAVAISVGKVILYAFSAGGLMFGHATPPVEF